MNSFKQLCIKGKENQKGVATLMIVTILTIVLVSISIALARTNLINFQSLETLKNSRKSYYLAESGIEDTLIQLEEDITYSGNPLGEVTPIGTYYSTVDNIGNEYTITASSTNVNTERIVNLSITLSYEVAEVTTKATYMADFFWLGGEGARVRGDVWTNDDFDIIENGVLEGNLVSIGKGSFAVNWVWDGIMGGDPELEGGQVLDNPETEEIIEGNIEAADAVKVSGPTAYVAGDVTSNRYVWEIFGGEIAGTITEYADLTWDPVPVPSFDFDAYKQQAVAKFTYYANASSFESYVDGLNDGTERRLPEDLYFVENGTVKIGAGDPVTPVYLDGLLVVKDSLYIYAEWHQNAQGGLPAIVCGKYLKIQNKFNFSSWNYDYAGPVRINGIIFAGKDLNLFRTFPEEYIIVEEEEGIKIDGAAWAGDDIYIKDHTYVRYNIDPLIVEGFDFVSGITGIQKNYWREVI